MADITASELFDRMPKAFLPDKAEGVDATIQFHLTGEGGGDWVVTIRDQKCTVQKDTVVDDPTMTLTAEAGDYVDVITGKVDPMVAFMQQKLKLKGNLNMAMGLMKYFKL